MFGERVGVACIISKGDPPITIEWFKDENPLSEKTIKGVTLISTNEFTSMLVIDNLTDKHSGEYTCKAFNNWAERSHSSVLKVNGTLV